MQIRTTNRYVLCSLLSKINTPFPFSPWAQAKLKILSYLKKGWLTPLNDEVQSISRNCRLMLDRFFPTFCTHCPCHKSFQPNCNFHVYFIKDFVSSTVQSEIILRVFSTAVVGAAWHLSLLLWGMFKLHM